MKGERSSLENSESAARSVPRPFSYPLLGPKYPLLGTIYPHEEDPGGSAATVSGDYNRTSCRLPILG